MFYDRENLNNNIDYHSLNFDEYIPDINLKNPEIINDLEIQITEEENFYRLELSSINYRRRWFFITTIKVLWRMIFHPY